LRRSFDSAVRRCLTNAGPRENLAQRFGPRRGRSEARARETLAQDARRPIEHLYTIQYSCPVMREFLGLVQFAAGSEQRCPLIRDRPLVANGEPKTASMTRTRRGQNPDKSRTKCFGVHDSNYVHSSNLPRASISDVFLENGNFFLDAGRLSVTLILVSVLVYISITSG
jgi:hypothetical protein